MSSWKERYEKRKLQRSLYAELVERSDEQLRSNDMDGSTAIGAVPAPHDKTWAELQGLSPESCADELLECMQSYMDLKFGAGNDGWVRYRQAKVDIGKINHKPYSWRTWR